MATTAAVIHFNQVATQVANELKLYNDALGSFGLTGKIPYVKYVWISWPYICLYKAPRTLIIHGDKVLKISKEELSDLMQQAMALCALEREYYRDQEVYRTCHIASKTKKPVRHLKNSSKWEYYRKILQKVLENAIPQST